LCSSISFADDQIPVVSASVARAGLSSIKQETAGAAVNASDDSVFEIKPGVNEIVKVAISHLNRFVTPFENPEIKTQASRYTSEISDNVVYFGTDTEEPVTIFIKEKGSEDQAISLTLIPLKIPPREITLKFPESSQFNFVGTTKAKRWEEAQPYIATIEQMLKAVALSEIPKGYKISQPTGELPGCRQTGLNFDFKNGQTLVGSHFDIQVGVATNVTNTPIEFVNDTCGDWNVAAVSAFPRQVLNSGEQTEVYVVVKKDQQKATTQKRKSLVQ